MKAWLPLLPSTNKKQSPKTVSNIIQQLNEHIHTAYQEGIGMHEVRHKCKPFWDVNIQDLATQKRIAAKSKTTAEGWQTYAHLRTKLKRQIRKRQRAAFERQMDEKLTKSCKTKQAWQAVSTLQPKDAALQGTYCELNGEAHTSKDRVAKAIHTRLTQVHGGHDPGDAKYDKAFHDKVAGAQNTIREDTVGITQSGEFTMKELQVCIRKLTGRQTKSPGPDAVKYWMIVRGGQSLHLALLTLFNYLWRTETIPQAWLEAHTRLLHKGKKSKYEITDHRPISLIACIGKLFTMLWLPRLEQILDPHIVPHQMAGKEGASSEEAAWTLASIIDHHTKGQTRKQHMYTCFADTETAYDTVWRDGLYFLLHAYGVRGPLLRMVVAWHEG